MCFSFSAEGIYIFSEYGLFACHISEKNKKGHISITKGRAGGVLKNSKTKRRRKKRNALPCADAETPFGSK